MIDENTPQPAHGVNMASCQAVMNPEVTADGGAPVFCGSYATEAADLTNIREAFGVNETMLPDMPLCVKHKEQWNEENGE